MSSSLLKRTRALLRNSAQTHADISKATGIPVAWINQFSVSRSHNPGVARVQKLYEHLSGKRLELK